MSNKIIKFSTGVQVIWATAIKFHVPVHPLLYWKQR